MPRSTRTTDRKPGTPRAPTPQAVDFWESVVWIRQVIETAVDAIIIIDARGLILYVNPAAQRLFGYESVELQGKNVSVLMPEPHRSRHDDYIQHYLDTGEARIIGIGREVQGLRKDSSTFPLFLSVSEVRLGDGRIFTGIVRDVTEEKRSQEEQARLLAELKERNKKITCLYSVGELIRGNAVEDELFESVASLVRPACCRPDLTRVRLTFDGRTHGASEIEDSPWKLSEDIVVGGRKRGLIELVYPIEPAEEEIERFFQRDQDLLSAIAHTLGEMQDRREAEAQVIQASKLASIGELASGVGHEINNPINSIINCADILIQNLDKGTKNRQFAELVRSEADRIATIVRDLLSFSRRERTQHRLAKLKDIAQGVLSLSKKRIANSRIQLDVTIPDDLPEVLCRPEGLQQVLMNLIINAIHALDEKYPEQHPDKKLHIWAEEIVLREKPYVRLVIEDRGVGISPEHCDRVFDPFFTTKGRDRGTGLGLSVSDEIVKEHQGTLWVESEKGVYTRIHVDLPLMREDHAPGANPTAKQHAAKRER